jgi:hypothetical protein
MCIMGCYVLLCRFDPDRCVLWAVIFCCVDLTQIDVYYGLLHFVCRFDPSICVLWAVMFCCVDLTQIDVYYGLFHFVVYI